MKKDWKKLFTSMIEGEAPLNKPFRTPGASKKFAVYVNDGGERKKVSFGDPNMDIKRDDPEAKKAFRARHGCDQAKDKTTAKYWSCKMWGKKPVSAMTKEEEAGTSDGAHKGWETRRAGGGGGKPASKDDEKNVMVTGGKPKGTIDTSAGLGDVFEPHADLDTVVSMKSRLGQLEPSDKDIYNMDAQAKKRADAEKKMRDKYSKREADKTGVRSPFWFYASEYYSSKSEAKPVVGEPEPKPLTKPDPSAEDQVNKILIENPQMSAPTLVNTLKAQGLAIVDQKDQVDAMKQADQMGGNAAVLRDGTNPKKKKKKYQGKEKAKEELAVSKEAMKDHFVRARFMEAEGGPAKGVSVKNRFRVALIQEGLGNLRDGFYYSAQAIKTGITAFEGKKCYADHPARSEEQDRPERSVRDIIGHFEGVHVQENDDGSVALCADLIILPDQPYEWARALVRQAVEYSSKYPDKDFIGLSINASGDAEAMRVEDFMKEGGIPESCKPKIMRAIEEGMTQVRVVHAIRDAISTDLVTEAGAKGRVLEIMENNKEANMAKKDILPKEAEDEMKQKHEDEAMDAPEKDEHADEEQDKKLILDMIKKHMGEEEMDEEEAMLAKQACEAYMEMGESEEEACESAAKAMKLAKHMGKKEAAKKEAEEEAKKEAEKKESEEEKKESEGESEGEAHKESATMKLEARIALLESELKKRDLVVYLDKKLAESKLPRSVTDKIRDKKLKSEKEVDEAIKIYIEAFKEAGALPGGESKAKSSGFFVATMEKQASVPAKTSKVSFK